MRIAHAALLLALVSLAACERVEFVSRTSATVAKSATVDQTLLQKIVDAPATVSWRGRRRFEAHYAVDGQPLDLVYEETVTTDGAGEFELVPEDLLVPSLSAAEEALFLLTQENREGLMFRHRDATVRDVDLFLGNYTVVDSGVLEPVLGRDCARWTVQAIAGGNVWTLWIDVVTGVILRSEERDASQALVTRVEYLDFDDSPDTSNAVWYRGPLEEAPLDLGQAKQALGFDPLKPKVVPASFRLVKSERVVEPIDHRTWARFTYTDGWSEFVFMDGGEMPVAQSSSGVSPAADVLRFTEIGSWAVADGRVMSRRILAAVRGDGTLLKSLVESAVH